MRSQTNCVEVVEVIIVVVVDDVVFLDVVFVVLDVNSILFRYL